MKLGKNVNVDVEFCDICGITWEDYVQKCSNRGDSVDGVGFGMTSYREIGYIHVCPFCEIKRAKNPTLFNRLIEKKIELKKAFDKLMDAHKGLCLCCGEKLSLSEDSCSKPTANCLNKECGFYGSVMYI